MEVKSKPSLHASWIDFRAKDIVRRLQDRGFTTYLVGGCVRDLLVGQHPKDYDIATSASPNDVKRLVPASYIIGRRFRLVLVKRGPDQFEVATFRRGVRPEDLTEGEDAPIGDNFFGTPEEDALRRDFTINALFYDPIRDELIDFAKGLPDIQDQCLRMIGDASARVLEDPIRALRAIRLSHKLKFRIDAELRAAICAHVIPVGQSILPRRREEYLKFLRLPDPGRAFLEMWDLGLIQTCLPSLIPIFENPDRLEVFLNHLARLEEVCHSPDRPVELYMVLSLAFTEASRDLENLEERREQFFRNELGLFKAESTEIQIALELSEKLKSVDSFRKRGARRQAAFLSQPVLPLALRVASFQQELSAEQRWFWWSKLHEPQAPSAATDSN